MITTDELWVRLVLTGYRGFVRPVLFATDPEVVHEQMIGILGQVPDAVLDKVETLLGSRKHPVCLAGITFPGRVGLAAGLDKDGLAARSWSALGFGFAELGTVTAHAQPGNRSPRIFRLPHSRAIINRMGFNNSGAEAMAARLTQWNVARGNSALGIPLGISIGKTKVTPLAEVAEDYLFSLRQVAPHADYVAINVSSPNTPNLRSLQARESLNLLVGALVGAARELDPQNPVPIFLKLAPDLSEAEIDALLEVCETHLIAGLVATNTTITRQFLHPSEAYLSAQAGGLSGAPLRRKSLAIVESIASKTSLPIIGSGGIMTPADAQAFFDAGARLIQIYTGFIFNGPALTMGINQLTYPDRKLR